MMEELERVKDVKDVECVCQSQGRESGGLPTMLASRQTAISNLRAV